MSSKVRSKAAEDSASESEAEDLGDRTLLPDLKSQRVSSIKNKDIRMGQWAKVKAAKKKVFVYLFCFLCRFLTTSFLRRYFH